MNMTEGSTTLNVPELRRLLTEWQQTRQALADNGMKDIILHGDLADKAIRLRGELDFRLLVAAPALLDAIERVEKLERLAETAQAVSEDSDTVGGPTWVPVSKGVFEAMREALAALVEAGPS